MDYKKLSRINDSVFDEAPSTFSAFIKKMQQEGKDIYYDTSKGYWQLWGDDLNEVVSEASFYGYQFGGYRFTDRHTGKPLTKDGKPLMEGTTSAIRPRKAPKYLEDAIERFLDKHKLNFEMRGRGDYLVTGKKASIDAFVDEIKKEYPNAEIKNVRHDRWHEAAIRLKVN